jgi:hypothetical protein
MFCPNCGTGNQTASFCTNCGSSINAAATAQPVQPAEMAPQATPIYQAPQPMANPYLPPPVEPKKKIKPVFIVAPVGAVAVIAILFAVIFGQTAGPLTQAQAVNWANSVEVPSRLVDFETNTPEDPTDLSSSFYQPKFDYESTECQAISDLDRLGRYMGSGQAGEQVLPDMLQGFDAWEGNRLINSSDAGGQYSYSTFDYGVLSFADEAAAQRYVADLAAAAGGCSSMEQIDVDSISYFQDTEDESTVPGFSNSLRLSYTSAFGFSLLGKTTVLASSQEFSIAQIGPNVVFTHGVVSEDAASELGVVISMLTSASDDIFSQASSLLNAAARG